jgi:hypothetical protein
VAVTADLQLGAVPIDRLAELPPGSVRSAGPDGLVVDRRNLHADLPFLVPTATVAVVGARVGADPTMLARVLGALEPLRGLVRGWRADADAVVVRVDPETAPRVEVELHRALVEPPA